MTGNDPHMVWHQDSELPDVDLVVLPGGFSYGDYLRCGAMASQSRIMREVKAHAEKGGAVLGICNGFQVLTESHMLPGALMRNADLKFVCRPVTLTVEETQSAFTRKYEKGQSVSVPGGAWRRQLLRRRRNAEPAGRREPRRVPLCRRRQSQRLGAQHRRHPEREAQRAGR